MAVNIDPSRQLEEEYLAALEAQNKSRATSVAPVSVSQQEMEFYDTQPGGSSSRAKTMAEEIKAARENPVIDIATETNEPQQIKNTAQLERLKRTDPAKYQVLKSQGIDALNESIKKERATSAFVRQQERKRQRELIKTVKKQDAKFKINNIKGGDGDYIDKNDYDNLTASQKKVFKSRGIDALNRYISKEYVRAVVKSNTLPTDAQKLYNKSGPEDRFAILKAYGKIPERAVYMGASGKTPLYRIGKIESEYMLSKEFDKAAKQVFLETTVPVYYTATNWKRMSPAEKAIALSLDVISIIPVSRLANVGRASQTVTKAARVKVVGKALARNLKDVTAGPAYLVLDPVGSAKQIGRGALDLFENIGHYKKLPEAVVTNTNGTFRIPVSMIGDAAEAKAARDQIMKAAIGGSDIVIETNGQRITLSRSALMRTLKGGVSHATPQGQAFIDGIKVKLKPDMPISEQGIFVAPEPAKKFSVQSAFGKAGEKPTIFIMDAEEAKRAISTKKIYKSPIGAVAELESKFATGYQIKEPKQILFTRVGPERTKVMVMLQKPLTPVQVAKLKGLAVVEDFKALYKPGLLIEGKDSIKGAAAFRNTLDENEIRELNRLLESSGNRAIAARLRAVNSGLATVRGIARRESTRGKGRAELVATGRIASGPASERINVYANRIGTPVIRPTSGKLPKTVQYTLARPQPEKSSRQTPQSKLTVPSERVTAKPSEKVLKTPAERVTDIPSERIISVPSTNITRIPEESTRKITSKRYQDKARKAVRLSNNTAIAWRQGQLNGKNRWDVVIDPYTSRENYFIIIGKRPKGVNKFVKGPRSAYKTAQTLDNVPHNLRRTAVIDNPGLFSTKFTPLGEKRLSLQFYRDADIQITGKGKTFPLPKRN